MDLKQYVRALRAHSALIVASVVVCTAAAAIYGWTREPVYAATTQLFVSTTADPSSLSSSEVYQGGLAAQSRAESYARIISSPPVAEAVVEDLGLDRSPEEIQQEISAAVPSGTVLIDVTVRDDSATGARDIARAVAEAFPPFVAELEGADPAEETPPVQVAVTAPATVPDSPESPNKALYVFGGVVLGLILGLGLAVLREVLDRRVRDSGDAEAIAGAPVLSHIPLDKGAKRRPLVVIDEPDSPQAEAYRRLRTNLRPVTIDDGRHSLLVTSAVPGEGKTLIAANLACAFAQAGHRAILVDGDLRRSQLTRMLGLDPTPGLSELLAGDTADDALRREHDLPLEVLAGGASPPNPSELLDSDRFETLLGALTRRAEIVIIDSPALLPVSDAAVMARSVAAVLMVARVSSTRAEQLDIAADSLRAVGKQAIGAVLNGLPARGGHDYVVYGARGRREAHAAAAAPAWD
jgi:succinoglycan biosynthesis transport protein ExoP